MSNTIEKPAELTKGEQMLMEIEKKSYGCEMNNAMGPCSDICNCRDNFSACPCALTDEEEGFSNMWRGIVEKVSSQFECERQELSDSDRQFIEEYGMQNLLEAEMTEPDVGYDHYGFNE